MNKSSSFPKQPLVAYYLVDTERRLVLRSEVKSVSSAEALNTRLAKSNSPFRFIPATEVLNDYEIKVEP